MTGLVVVDQKVSAEVANRIGIIVDWTADTDGNVISDPIDVVGFLYEVETIPGALGVPATNAPLNKYDITITDPHDYDLMKASLINNRSSTVAEREVTTAPQWVQDAMTVSVFNAGALNQGRIIIWIDGNLHG